MVSRQVSCSFSPLALLLVVRPRRLRHMSNSHRRKPNINRLLSSNIRNKLLLWCNKKLELALVPRYWVLPQSAPQAQSSPTPQFCYNGQCRESLPEAVALMRADPQYAPLGGKLELADTRVNPISGMAEKKPVMTWAPQ